MRIERKGEFYEAPELTAFLLAVEAGFAKSPVIPGTTPGGTGSGVEEDDEDDL